ncbi:anion exchange protein-like, partial [Tropilaelaps mercedesae]
MEVFRKGTAIETGSSENPTNEHQSKNNGNFLVHKTLKKIPLRDFGSEVRAVRDLKSDLSIILDSQEMELVAIVKQLLGKMFNENTALITATLENIFFCETDNAISDLLMSASAQQSKGIVFDSSYLCIPCSMPTDFAKRFVGVCRLATAVNFGTSADRVRFIVVVVTPVNVKATKTSLEVMRTFSTLLSNPWIRHRLTTEARTENDLKAILTDLGNFDFFETRANTEEISATRSTFYPFRGIIQDFRRKLPHYLSDFGDGIKDRRSIYKTTSTTLFLYFSILLPVIAFGTLNNTNTAGEMSVRKTLISQVIGGLFFALASGQPLVILMTTAPLSLYIKVVYSISTEWNTDFGVMYANVGLFCSAFLVLYAIFDVSRIMCWLTRSTEEIFSLFISVAFCIDAGKDVYHYFDRYYTPCWQNDSSSGDETSRLGSSQLRVLSERTDVYGGPDNTTIRSSGLCRREAPLLFIILMLATLWLGLILLNLTRTPYLSSKLRGLFSEYALPLAVIAVSLFGILAFPEIPTNDFKDDTRNS